MTGPACLLELHYNHELFESIHILHVWYIVSQLVSNVFKQANMQLVLASCPPLPTSSFGHLQYVAIRNWRQEGLGTRVACMEQHLFTSQLQMCIEPQGLYFLTPHTYILYQEETELQKQAVSELNTRLQQMRQEITEEAESRAWEERATGLSQQLKVASNMIEVMSLA